MNDEQGQSTVTLRRFPGDPEREIHDRVICEEPLEIRVNDQPLAVTMRTPGSDLELVAGFLWTEGIIQNVDQILTMEHCREDSRGNTVSVRVADEARDNIPRLERHFYTTSSCGICGQRSMDAVARMAKPFDLPVPLNTARLTELPALMQAAQRHFPATGGCHAAGWFDRDARLLCLREDVGRHNAVDKLVGWALLSDRWPIPDSLLLVSGRVSFEIMQKSVMARVPAVVAVGAPTSLAVEAARRFNQALVGFCRQGGYNLYHDPNTNSYAP